METLAQTDGIGVLVLAVIVATPRITKYTFISLMWAWGIDWR